MCVMTLNKAKTLSTDTLLSRWDLHEYQVEAIRHQLAHPESMLWLDMGLGKSIIQLTAIAERMDQMLTFGTLIVAPLRVCQTVWQQEAKKWEHTQHLTFSRVTGKVNDRERALRTNADVYLLNYENVPWFVDRVKAIYLAKGMYPPFDAIVFDEVTKMKDASTKRHKALRDLLPYTRFRTGLTGTPASNGYKDLFGQYLAVDMGTRLGHSQREFKDNHCYATGFGGFQIGVTSTSEKIIQETIADITLQMNSADYLDLPKVTVNDLWVDLTPVALQQYKDLEDNMFIELDEVAIEVFNAAAMTNKCLQAANGALYTETGEWEFFHDEKIHVLDDIIEEAGGQPVLLCYEFRSDLERIMERFPNAVHLGGTMSDAKLEDIMARWNAGEIPLMVGHPASMGHGLNLQYGGHTLVWFGLNWSLDLYLQANARVDRQGQTKSVVMHRILTRNTLDEAVSQALQSKATTQSHLRSAIEDYRRSA